MPNKPWFVFIPWKGFYDIIFFIFQKFVSIEHEEWTMMRNKLFFNFKHSIFTESRLWLAAEENWECVEPGPDRECLIALRVQDNGNKLHSKFKHNTGCCIVAWPQQEYKIFSFFKIRTQKNFFWPQI